MSTDTLFSSHFLLSIPSSRAGDPPHVSGAVIGLVVGLAVAVTGANVWYFRYRRNQEALARENEYAMMEAQ